MSSYDISDVMHDGLLWMDVETTGVDGDSLLLEVALQATDMYGMIVDNGCHVIIHHDMIDISSMSIDVVNMHTTNRLFEDVKKNGISLDDAAIQLRAYVQRTLHRFDVCYPAGYSVSFDITMIDRWLPHVLDDVGHRVVDVTSMNIIADHFFHDLYRGAAGRTDHRAATCVNMEMERYRYYLEALHRID